MTGDYVRWFEQVTNDQVALVGGKNASLGEMVSNLAAQGVRVPEGFATTTDAYWHFIDANALRAPLNALFDERQRGDSGIAEAGSEARRLILEAHMPRDVEAALRDAYRVLCERTEMVDVDVAVRSSASAEDLPHASFAGQQESFLNVRGADSVVDACRRCFASLFTDRAISYREEMDFDHMSVGLSAGVQRMVRSDGASSGVMFTLDPESGFDSVVLINSTWGLGESVVKGLVDPDQYTVFKPPLEDPSLCPIIERRLGAKQDTLVYGAEGGVLTRPTSPDQQAAWSLTDDEVLQLARWGVIIESHYGCPMDIEWAKDAKDGNLYVVQARPETVRSREGTTLVSYSIAPETEPLVRGVAVGSAVAAGDVVVIRSPDEASDFPDGAVLVAERTDPDWGPLLARASAVVTDRGGRTSHAAIVSRELGIPAIVGAGTATTSLADGAAVTVSCAEGDEGRVYAGTLPFQREEIEIQSRGKTPVDILMNLGNPGAAFRWWRLPVDGIGLARLEFIISESVGIHPMALAHPEQVQDAEVRKTIIERTRGLKSPAEYFVRQLVEGISRLAAVVHPRPAIVRTSDFKSNEYAALLGGEAFEPDEENPMLGVRGAARYRSPRYKDAFLLECEALRRVREDVGLTNVVPMIPFCRTLDEADGVLELMASAGLERGRDGLQIYVMCEIPSNVILATEFAQRFDGFSIGTNDLTQLTLGVDRDSVELKDLFSENDPAVREMIKMVIERAHAAGRPVGLCGQAPSDDLDFARFLVEAGIDSMSLNPDSVLGVIEALRV